MRPLKSSAVGLKLGLILATGLGAMLRWRFPAFFEAGLGEPVAFVLVVAALPTLLAFLLGLFLDRGGSLAIGATGLLIGAALALLDLHTPSPAGIISVAIGSALVAWLVASWRAVESKRATALCAVTSIALLVAMVAGPKPPQAALTGHPKIFVFGLDAGTWTILDELFAKDELPNLRRIRDEGTSGVLRSEVASLSPRVWTTIATGKVAAKHGVLDFFCTQNENLTTRRIWEMLQSQGWSVGLFQWLLTWPPDPFDPFIVPAWMARGPQTRPMELSFIKELELTFQTGEFRYWLDHGYSLEAATKLRDCARGYLEHGLRLRTLLKVVGLWFEDSAATREIARLERPGQHELSVLRSYATKRMVQLLINGDVYLDLYRRHQPDFSCYICYGTDNLAHKFWQYHFPDDFGIPHERAAPFAEILTDYYRECDRLLGEIVPLLPPQTTVAVLSDHGFTSGEKDAPAHQHEHRPKMNRLSHLLGLTEADVQSSAIATRGYFRPMGDQARARATSRKILDFLEACVTVDGGGKVFLPSELDTGEVEVAVNLAIDLRRETPVDTPLGKMTYGDLADIEERTGGHSIDGIMLLRGPNLRRGVRIDGARLRDVTPTLLYLEDQPVGADMDGDVLFDAIEPRFREEHEVERIASWDERVTVTRDRSVSGDDRAMRNYAGEIGYIGDGQGTKPDPGKKPGDRPER